MEGPNRLPLLLGVIACVAVLAGLAREIHNYRVTYLRGGNPSAGWFSADPDGLYHTRRLARLLDEGGPVAVSDPLFNHPRGALVPWPPYYTRVLQAALSPLAPEGEARDEWLERAVATLPMIFGVLTAAVLAAAAWREGGFIAAGLAGATFAWLGASLNYSVPGIGDHHAFATMLTALMFGLTAYAFGKPSGVPPLVGALLGLAAGGAAGLLVGSWVGGLVPVMIVQLALGWLVVVHGRKGERALVPYGLAFHAAYAGALAPAVLASPWKDEFPWMVVTLSWFHLAHAAAGFLVFVPLLLLWPGKRPAQAYPWIVAGALIVVGITVVTGDAAFAVGIREGFAWTGRANAFMAYITESQPLMVGQIGGPGHMTQQLGLTIWLLVPAWGWAAWRAIHSGRTSLVVWVIAVPPMLAQALMQRRFAEALGVPMAVVVATAIAHLPGVRFRSAWAMGVVGLLLGTALQWPMLSAGVLRVWHGERYVRSPIAEDMRSYRAMYEWLGEHAPADGDTGVLATWDQGHPIEWVAGRPTVANNFGSYIGEDSYLDPWRFFLEEDLAAAEARLAERQVRHVLVTGQFSKDLEVMLRLLRADSRREFLVFRRPIGARPSARWYRTMSGRLLVTGRALDPDAGELTGDSLDFLRLVHVSPRLLHVPVPIPHSGQRVPAGWIWERVPGARLQARGAPGERLEVHFDVTYPAANRKLLWTAETTAGPDGVATLRVPYATDANNGDGVPDPEAQWTFGDRSGVAVIPEAAVFAGGTVELAGGTVELD